ncbi:MAG: peptidoglycan bridge formation glycyltransferase FemA/FemB family protein [Candidatus Peribacteraceae bacterium]|nr:peptidoglycan bridge formation glycyltransferase FemA/FemB family protein [Candidatus Peribacteraceae bacterium]
MEVRQYSSGPDLQIYDAWVRAHPDGSLWQALSWKTYQEALGRETRIYVLLEGAQIVASALVVVDRTAFGFSTWNIPRGPLFGRLAMSDERLSAALLDGIIFDAMKERCLSLFLSPPIKLNAHRWPLAASPRHEQPEATRLINLTQSETEILKKMKPKGRYNIAVAEKHDVRVAPSQDIDAFYALLKETGGRDQFGILPKVHYGAFLRELPGSFLLLAPLPASPQPIAGLLGVVWGTKGIYYYGASKYAERASMAPYALQWAAMRHRKAHGCRVYDLLGVAPPDADVNHPWHGVSMFKEKFGGEVLTYPPEQQIILRPTAYQLLRMKRRLLG